MFPCGSGGVGGRDDNVVGSVGRRIVGVTVVGEEDGCVVDQCILPLAHYHAIKGT